ncbi:hypothetical protein Tco_0455420 [Tanacetum coccineum]
MNSVHPLSRNRDQTIHLDVSGDITPKNNIIMKGGENARSRWLVYISISEDEDMELANGQMGEGYSCRCSLEPKSDQGKTSVVTQQQNSPFTSRNPYLLLVLQDQLDSEDASQL